MKFEKKITARLIEFILEENAPIAWVHMFWLKQNDQTSFTAPRL